MIFSAQQLVDSDKQKYQCKDSGKVKSLGSLGGYECSAMGYFMEHKLILDAEYPAVEKTC
jgi:hypothetical protein